MAIRDVVQIDEEKCDGCGLCVPSCEEGAIRIVGSKAKVVSDIYCDGLGACLGQCPQGAISIVQREAADFDQEAVAQRMRSSNPVGEQQATSGSCPGSQVSRLPGSSTSDLPGVPKTVTDESDLRSSTPSRLANWPVQLQLVPPDAPYLRRAELLLAADCAPFAYADFHSEFLDGNPLVIGCPKLDDGQAYVQKLAMIIKRGQIRSLTVVRMEVPCCMGLMRIAEMAVQLAESDLKVGEIVITTKGTIQQPTRGVNGLCGATPNGSIISELPVIDS